MFSETEARILKILGNKVMTIKELTKKLHDEDPPHNANNQVAAAIRSIIYKCYAERAPFILEGKGYGRAGRTVWKKKKCR